MKFTYLILILFFSASEVFPQEDKKISIGVFTGGHDFDRDLFFGMLESFPMFEFTELKQPEANDYWLGAYEKDFDALLFYDMVQEISEAQKKGFEQKVKAGIGMVFLHHAIVSYQHWDYYQEIVGGGYVEPSTDPAKPSGYQHDLEFRVRIIDPQHPITSNLKDFNILDEIYINVPVNKNIIPLAMTDHPKSMNPLVWCQEIGSKTRTVYIQPGHGPQVFTHPEYRKLLRESLLWVTD